MKANMLIIDELNELSADILGDTSYIEKLSAIPDAALKTKEIEACLRWQKNRNQQDFDFLWESLKPIVNKALQKHTYGSPVPQSSFRGPVMDLFVKSLETYDPKFGTGLSTHVINYMKRLFRINLAYQNVARISSESVASKINMFKNRKSFLEDRLGREPTSIELADDLGWGMKDVERMERDIRADIFVGQDQYVTGESLASARFMDKLNTMYMFETNAQEKLVMEYTFGLGGKPVIKKNIEIAQKIGITPNRVSQIKDKLAKKLRGN